MFTVKATYHGETRRITFAFTFPTFDQLCEQLRRVFPLSNSSFTITRLLFSPDSAKSIRLLIGQRVHTAADYIRYTEPYRGGIWQDATLRLTVVDGDCDENPNVTGSTSRYHSHSSYSDMSSNNGDNQSYLPEQPIPISYIPPPPILFPSYSVPASTSRAQPTGLNGASSTSNHSPCCSIEAGKREIQVLIDIFMRDLDKIVTSNFSVQDSRVTSDQSQQDPEQESTYPRSCARCKRSTKGLQFYCDQCGVDVCSRCYSNVACHKCPAKITGYHHLMRHPSVPTGPRHSRYATRQVYSQPPVVSAPVPQRNTTRRFGSPTVNNTASTATPIGSSSFQGGRHSESTAPLLPQRNNMYEGVAHNAVCDLCDSGIRGYRYKCLVCPDFDTCANCFSITDEQHPGHSFIKLSNPDDYIHRHGTRPSHRAMCNVCNAMILGVRYKCLHPDCLDFDLCERCEAYPIPQHPKNHPLLKIKSENTMVPQIKRNPVPPAAVAIPRPVSPIDLLTAQGTKTPTAAVKVLQPSPFDGKAPIDQQTDLSPKHQVAEVHPVSSPIRCIASETPLKPSEDEFLKEESNTFSPTLNVASEVEKTTVESPLVNEAFISNTSSAAPVEVFLSRAVLNAVIVKDVTVPNGQAFPPGAEFIKTWLVVNSGLKEWPKSTELVFTGGDAMTLDSRPILIGNVKAGAEVELSTRALKAPESIGSYTGCWKLQTEEDGLFGDNLWIDINVTEPQGDTESLSSSSIMQMPQSVLHEGNRTASDNRTSRDETISNAGSSGTAGTLDNMSYDSDWQDCPGDPAGHEEYVILYDDSSSEEN